jgi:hypothetical protein
MHSKCIRRYFENFRYEIVLEKSFSPLIMKMIETLSIFRELSAIEVEMRKLINASLEILSIGTNKIQEVIVGPTAAYISCHYQLSRCVRMICSIRELFPAVMLYQMKMKFPFLVTSSSIFQQ